MPEPKPIKLAQDLGAKVRAAIDRADELGGDLRDYLQARWASDPRLAGVRARVSKLRGLEPVTHGAKVASAGAEVAKVAAVVKAAEPKRTGMGNPALPAQVYGRKSCPWTGRAMSVLEKRNVDYDFIDLEEAEHEALMPVLTTETHQHTVPFVYLRGQFIGGFNALAEIERLGQLEFALMSAEERAAAPAHLRMIEIAARPNTDEVAPAEADAAVAAE